LIVRQPLQATAHSHDVRHLIWQGLLSFASSAALDEMFGASGRAATGYAQAATLAWLLQRFGDNSGGAVGGSSAAAVQDDAAAFAVTNGVAAGAPADAWGGSSDVVSTGTAVTPRGEDTVADPPDAHPRVGISLVRSSGALVDTQDNSEAAPAEAPCASPAAEELRASPAMQRVSAAGAHDAPPSGSAALAIVLALGHEELRVLKLLMDAMHLRHAACTSRRAACRA
jgi:hypothetical protein